MIPPWRFFLEKYFYVRNDKIRRGNYTALGTLESVLVESL